MNLTFQDVIHGIGRYWFLILIGIWVVYAMFDESASSSAPLPPPITPTAQQVQEIEPVSLPTDVSLSTGTVLKSRSAYLSGDGELQIKNGTDLDAVAKLIRDGTSVFTVYIKANSTYTMENITDGIYWLAFVQGSNWDTTTKTFTRNTQYSAFEDTFDFETSDTEYTIFEITLNPVIGGTAETNPVNPSQFDAY